MARCSHPLLGDGPLRNMIHDSRGAEVPTLTFREVVPGDSAGTSSAYKGCEYIPLFDERRFAGCDGRFPRWSLGHANVSNSASVVGVFGSEAYGGARDVTSLVGVVWIQRLSDRGSYASYCSS